MRTFPLLNVFKADYQFPSHLDLRGNGLSAKRQGNAQYQMVWFSSCSVNLILINLEITV